MSNSSFSQPSRSHPDSLWQALARLIRLPNQTGTLLLLFPTLWSLVLASKGQPPFQLLIIFICGSFLMRSAGVIMNDLADRSFDRQVRRTQQRPLAKGTLTPLQAWGFLGFLLGIAAVFLYLLNPFTRWLGPIAVILAAIYPFCKRFLHIPQIVLGVAFGWGTVMAWTAVTNHLAFSTWLLFAATISWAVAYDTIYAIQDMEDDRRIGVKSSALFFGPYLWLGVSLAILVMLACLSMTGYLLGLGIGFFACLIVSAGIMGHQIIRLRSSVNPKEAFIMFQQHNWVGAILLLGTYLGHLT
ncbi:MAG: 4-hydroxybenzoate octaprenyltransferase [Nitrospira sp.]|nr:4-hydroxybenzoate octaprenyltransferase [Nitrospira sp.]